ncbi:MAG: TIGR00300 family protein [Methanocalculus sp. MSAO_Arc1]|uniref:ornithine cyclodeaminase n=1 Tax=Methanocalculus TaxID=71151 RepID=UPI000FF82251|nr:MULTISPECIES: TIGR00300 family protein [unclassified Methanocalculus]MCP1662848.1 lysine-ketoglutarate reductase/saccharopine dehydrogenase-like protein (TIGR00300 family) [Methanocalculus sp. AMF5]RQD78990.1 MAG: TIGR00300 family protein [Methanocalculus sp. MSAO_Arc1]
MDHLREMELEGHIIDSGIMTRVFDRVMDMGGDFEIITFEVGKRKADTSYARLEISAATEEKLDQIASELHRYGARLIEADTIRLVAAEADRVVPKGFYSTTNHPTSLWYNDEWIPVENIEMDCILVVDPATQRAFCTPLSKLRRGDCVVIGEKGVRVVYPERPRETGMFEFMHGQVSSERPSETIVKKIADELLKVKEKGLKVALVGGPAIVHTGAGEALAALIREGYIDVLFSGNALATHDIEYNLFGTSLGMDLKTGDLITGGHKHHIYAISEVMRAGSIPEAVEHGIITGGIMYECVRSGIPYVLAGSIRDDGPLPDVITDVVQAQDAMREHIGECGMVLMIGTLLHSVAVGNSLPSYVKTICVDINPASVTKLMDRGTTQAIGVVSDAGSFIPALHRALNQSRE